MALKVDSKNRLTSKKWFPTGSVFEPSKDEQGRIVLRELKPVEPRRITARLVRRKGRLIFQAPVEVSPEAIGRAVAEERASR